MVKNGKAKGTLLENEFKDAFEKQGYYATRAAGSFGIDLVAFSPYEKFLINVKWKRKYCGPAERKELLELAKQYDAVPMLAYKKVPKGKKNAKRILEILVSVDEVGYTLVLEKGADIVAFVRDYMHLDLHQKIVRYSLFPSCTRQ